ncbi:MAG: hypothetical protein ACYCSP_04230 [Acidobacteriaceae bacterium]
MTSYYYRGDSASHEKELLGWLRDEKRADGPQGKIGFAISARMSEALHRAISQVHEAGWNLYGNADILNMAACSKIDRWISAIRVMK